MNQLSLLIAICVCLAGLSLESHAQKASSESEWLVDRVNVLGGTYAKYDYSRGSTLPLITRPWGFDAWAPQTNQVGASGSDGDPRWWFEPYDKRIFGIRNTRQPSPWIADYGEFLVKTYITGNPSHSETMYYTSGFDSSKAVIKPYLFETELMAFSSSKHGKATLALTSTRHGAVMKAHFPYLDKPAVETGYNGKRRVAIVLNDIQGEELSYSVNDASCGGTTTIRGISKANSGGLAYTDAFNHYFVIAIYRAGVGADNVPLSALECSDMATNGSPWLWCDFASTDDSRVFTHSKTSKEEDIVIKIGTSFISYEQALLNLRQEIGDHTFEDVMRASKQEWEAQLSKMTINAISTEYTEQEQQDMLTMFYSASYRSALFPRDLSEVNSNGETVHFSPYIKAEDVKSPDDLVYNGPLTADQGWWDAYTTVYPLYSLINLDVLGSILSGWLQTYKESGWMQQWPSPGTRGCMVGTASDISFGDAIVKGIEGFDRQLAYEAMKKNAFTQPREGDGNVGRVCLDVYIEYGYIPYDNAEGCTQVVSRTLSYWQSDYAIAQAAKHLGYTDDAQILMSRAMNYTLLFDQQTAFFREKGKEGKYNRVFDDLGWGDPYTEAGPYQYRFAVPWDSKGLASLFASYSVRGVEGEKAETGERGERGESEDISTMCGLLEDIQLMPSTFHVGGYGEEIHEQTEMAMNCWGQYAHNNQPSHYLLWMFGAISDSRGDGSAGSTGTGGAGGAGGADKKRVTSSTARKCKALGDKYLRKVMRELYKNDVQMFAGDEDNGQMSAWYLLASMGLYTVNPGSTVMNLGSPLFEDMEILMKGKEGDEKVLRIVAKNNGPEHVYVKQVWFNGNNLGEGVNSIEYQELVKGGVLEFVMSDKV